MIEVVFFAAEASLSRQRYAGRVMSPGGISAAGAAGISDRGRRLVSVASEN